MLLLLLLSIIISSSLFAPQIFPFAATVGLQIRRGSIRLCVRREEGICHFRARFTNFLLELALFPL